MDAHLREMGIFATSTPYYLDSSFIDNNGTNSTPPSDANGSYKQSTGNNMPFSSLELYFNLSDLGGNFTNSSSNIRPIGSWIRSSSNETFPNLSSSSDTKHDVIHEDGVYNRIFEISSYVIFAEVVLGILTNALSLAVLNRKSFSGQSSSIYLQVLAMTDLIMSLSTCAIAIPTAEHQLCQNSAFCYFHSFITLCCTVLGNWTTVLLSVERLIAILFPLSAKRFLSRKRTKITMMITWGLATLYSAYGYLFIGNYDCNALCRMMHSPGSDIKEVIANGNTVVIFIVPFSILSITSVLLCAVLLRSRKKRKTMTFNSNTTSGRETGMIVTILFLNSYFLATRLPYEIHKLLILDNSLANRAKHRAIKSILVMLLVSNNFINMFLYVATTLRFRIELKSMFSRRPQGNVSQSNATQSSVRSKAVTSVREKSRY